MNLLNELAWRGLIHQCTDQDGLAKLLDSAEQTVYVGFDPTATSLHVGSMMQLMMLRRFQKAGHRTIALVGGATGMIGDPSGKSEERNLLSADQLQQNVEGLAAQMRQFLDFEGDHAAILLNNFQWMEKYSYLDFLRDVGKSFPVGVMMGKDSVRSRLGSEAGLSYTEFSYMLLQAYDFVYLAREHGCRVQAGGSDQWGNITAGIDLGRRMLGQQLYGVTAPLLTTSDGRKMGKTESGAVWLDPQRTSPYEFFQYWRNVEDADVMRCIAFLTEIERDVYDALAEQTAADPSRRAAQNRLAEWMTQLVHGDEALAKAKTASASLFGGGIKDASGAIAIEMLADVPSTEMEHTALTGEGLWIVDALQSTGLCQSGGEARRTIKEGGCYVNDQRITDVQHRLGEDDVSNESVIVMRRGKKKYALLRFK
jgi:tyrosyl-tRNA synthetase